MVRKTGLIVCPVCDTEIGRVEEDFVVYFWNSAKGKRRKLLNQRFEDPIFAEVVQSFQDLQKNIERLHQWKTDLKKEVLGENKK